MWAGSENFGSLSSFVSSLLALMCLLPELLVSALSLPYCYLSLGVLITHGNRVILSLLSKT